MKYVHGVIPVALAIVISLAAGAHARSLEEILKEKAVLTEKEYHEATKKRDLAYYDPGEGITIETEDGKFKAQLGGRLQTRYTFEDPGRKSADNESSFSIERMKLWLQGNIYTKRLKYKYQQDKGDFQTGYLSYEFAEPFEVKAGQFNPPQSRQEMTSSARQLLVDRSLANETFNLGRDIGIQISGKVGDEIVGYALGIFNGNGPRSNRNDDHLFALRIDIESLGKFSRDESARGGDEPLLNFGGSFAFQRLTGDDVGRFSGTNELLDQALDLDDLDDAKDFTSAFGDDLKVTAATVNIHFKWKRFTLGGEYYYMNAAPDEGDDFDADGFYVQGGYMLIPKTLEAAVRYSAVSSRDNNALDQFEEAEFQLGLNYYIHGHDLKIQADYTRAIDDLDVEGDDHIVRLQAQVIF